MLNLCSISYDSEIKEFHMIILIVCYLIENMPNKIISLVASRMFGLFEPSELKKKIIRAKVNEKLRFRKMSSK